MSTSDEEKFELYQDTTENAGHSVGAQESVSSPLTAYELESTEFMTQDGEELIDLDALFDALNLVAKENAEAFNYSDSSEQGGSILTVSNKALASVGVSSSLEDLNTVTSDGLQDQIISDVS